MTDEQLIAEFLELQEQAEHMSDGQLQQALDNGQMQELMEQMAFAKQAFKHEEMQTAIPSVDEEWAKFAATYSKKQQTRGRAYKIAASFVGILLVSAIAIAAINLVHSESKTAQEEQTLPDMPAISGASLLTDTISVAPYVFDNVALEKMLTVIAAAHHVSVEFQNDGAKQLRFHFVWKRQDSLVRIVEKLNTFERVNIVVENKKLIVK